ncbi:MotA/TolQ/ExbB proton channel family protein [Flavobacterium sp. 83]|uniref:MotA/TolQ/ExbB proton channel family protein n=1 Tax=Flavobacterium sp. 83 TaxID=1131812 RepID=UPI0005504ECA|nr:MotA/TolQ/ExbB proton channel family protein [Flavobacterium sp. 83]
MLEISIALIIFAIWSTFSIVYYNRYKRFQLNDDKQKGNFWNNSYIFDIIPSVFPTLGIFCTALGITIGIWNFDTTDIQGSIPQLLGGLKIAFIATMAGIIGLIIFQKWNALIQKEIEESPNRPVKHTDELAAINALNQNIIQFKESLIVTIEKNLEEKVAAKLTSLEGEIISLNKLVTGNHKIENENLTELNTNTKNSRIELKEQFKLLRDESKSIGEKSNKNTKEIIDAMSGNNKFIVKKFDEFSELMSKNNTEALVDVMKNVTEQFNKQMSELINRLVQENFAELNKSVQSMNDWQKDNKEQIKKLTDNFQKTTELFDISSKTLSEVALNSKSLIDDNSKLVNLVETLEKVMISDNKFSEITNNLVSTIDTLKETTDSFEETTNKLNDWVRTERNFKESADIIIVKLEEFRDFKSDVWENYRKEMNKSVTIMSNVSKQLGEDLSNINNEFYERLNDTLNNLDLCIQRFVPSNKN